MPKVKDFFDTYGRRAVSGAGVGLDDELTEEVVSFLLRKLLSFRNTLPAGNGKPVGVNRFYAKHAGGHYYLRSPRSIIKEVSDNIQT